MKKVLTVIMLAALLAGCTAAAAYAQTSEEYVKELATSNAKVVAAECVIYQRACVVAIKTEKFTTKSEYDEYADGLAERIKTDCEVDYVFISRSPKLMNTLVRLNKLDEQARSKAIEEIIERELERRENGNRESVPPRFLQECGR